MIANVNRELVRHLFEETIPFCRLLGLKLIEIKSNLVSVKIPFRVEFMGDVERPALHGGVIAALLDTVGGAAALTVLQSEEDRLSTIDLRVDYLLPGEPKDLYAEGVISRSGNRIVVTRMVAFQEKRSHVIAEGRGVYNIHRRGD